MSSDVDGMSAVERLSETEERLLQMAGGVSAAAEVVGTAVDEKSAEILYGGEIAPHRSLSSFLSLRIIRGGRLGGVGGTASSPGKLLDMAISTARVGPEACFEFPGSAHVEKVRLVDPATEALGCVELARSLSELRARTTELYPYSTLEGNLAVRRLTVSVRNSRGLQLTYHKALLEWDLQLLVPTADGLVAFTSSAATGRCPDLPGSPLLDSLPRPDSLNEVEAPEDSPARVVFSPEALSVLLQPVRVGVSGRSMLAGSSPLRNMEGGQVFSSVVTLVDRPLMDLGASSAPFDAEGVPTRDKALFERGVFDGFVFDLATAAQVGRESTGNAGRDYDTPPSPVVTNLEMASGEGGLASLLERLEDGYFVCDFQGGNSDAVTGDLTLDAGAAFRVRGGELEGRLRRLTISGNAYRLLSRVIALSGERRLSGTDLLPYALVEGVELG